ncbi:hypothetical protein ACVWWZ_001355 [Thermostichus sp. OS-CIW-39]
MVQERSDRILPISEQEGGIPQSPEEYPPSAFPLHFPATVAVDSKDQGETWSTISLSMTFAKPPKAQ